MKITILGTGTSQGIPIIGCTCDVCNSPNPKDKRLRVSIHIKTHKGTNILVDSSPDLRQQLLTNKITEIDALLVTHEHNDHVIGLDDLRPINFIQKKEMPLYALPRVIKDIEHRFQYIFDSDPYPGAPRISTIPIEHDELLIGQEKITCIHFLHGTLPILGFRIGDFAYLTDIKTITEEEKQKLKGIKVLITSALRLKEHFAHMNLDEALCFIEEINPEKAYLTHMGHALGTHDMLLQSLPANVFPAFDGQVLDI